MWQKALILSVCVSLLGAQAILFPRERIEVTVTGDRAQVRGRYFFRNTGPQTVTRSVYYPFSFNYQLTWPEAIRVRNLSTQTNLSFARLEQGLQFRIIIPAKSEVEFEVVYQQRTPVQVLEYILTTTARWRRPLEQAEYIVTLGPGLKLNSLSLPYDYKQIRGDSTRYLITRRAFMPDSNLIVKWEGG